MLAPAISARPAGQWPLDALNFFLADVAGGLGPYLAVYLLAVDRQEAGHDCH